MLNALYIDKAKSIAAIKNIKKPEKTTKGAKNCKSFNLIILDKKIRNLGLLKEEERGLKEQIGDRQLQIRFLEGMPDIAEYIENPSKGVICQQDDILMTRTGNTGKVITGVKGVFHNNFFF